MAPRISEMVTIPSGHEKIAGYISRPDAPGRHHPIFILHEWWGLVDHIKDVANRYADQGYVAVALDLFKGQTADSREGAQQLSSQVTPEYSSRVLADAMSWLRTQLYSRLDRIGVTGFCFGGTHAFRFACQSKAVQAGVIFYASRLPEDELLEKTATPLLILYGDQDGSVPVDQSRKLEATLKSYGKDVELVLYPGARHAFFNDSKPETYNADAASDSWKRTIAFFDQRIKQQ